MSLAYRHIVITGGTRGIGLCIARVCAEVGGVVTITGRNDRDGEAAQRRLQQWGRAQYRQCDTSRPDDVCALFERLRDEGQPCTDIVCNAAIGGRRRGDGPVDECTIDAWDQVIATNLTGPFLTMKYAMPDIITARGGIIGISSVAAVVGTQERFGAHAYASSKAGLLGLCRAVAVQYGQRGVRANCVLPGVISTDNGTEPRTRETVENLIGCASDVASTCAFLLSPAGRHINGADIPLDGGFLAQ